jgi:hypothetical protein
VPRGIKEAVLSPHIPASQSGADGIVVTPS